MLIGSLFCAGALQYTYAYLVETENPLRHEYTFGIVLSLLYGVCALLLAALLALSVKDVISRKAFLILSVPALFSGVVFLGLYFYSLGIGTLGK